MKIANNFAYASAWALRSSGDGGVTAPRAAAGAELAPRGPADRHVQLRDADLQPQRGVVLDRLVDGLVGDVGRAPVALDPHAVDRRAVLDQPPEQHHRTLVLGAGLDAVVVVVQLGVRVGLVGVLEREREELRPHGPQPLGVAEVLRLGRLGVAAVVDRLVDDVPALDLPLVAPDQRGDVVLHALGDDLLVAAGEEPVVRLGVPHEGVAVDGELVLGAPLHQGVGPLETPLVLAGVDRPRLHAVLRRHDVEVPLDEAQLLVGVVAGDVPRRADEEVVLVNVLDGRAGLASAPPRTP